MDLVINLISFSLSYFSYQLLFKNSDIVLKLDPESMKNMTPEISIEVYTDFLRIILSEVYQKPKNNSKTKLQ